MANHWHVGGSSLSWRYARAALAGLLVVCCGSRTALFVEPAGRREIPGLR
jgi:hypothetical protein